MRYVSGVSYNQPTFCSSTNWTANAITFAGASTVSAYPFSMFVNTNNTIYVAALSNHSVQVWIEGNSTPTNTITDGLTHPNSVFATVIGDAYIDNGENHGRVDRWSWGSTTGVPVMNVSSQCLGLFIDIKDVLYCSLREQHKVVKRSLAIGNSNGTSIAAGNGTIGSLANQLSLPHGIFVDLCLNLHVADCGNNRIQRFAQEQLSGTTVAGAGASPYIALSGPTGVVLDADGYLFIADRESHRIISSGLYGFRCVAGGSGSDGSAMNRLYKPRSLSFDSYGNMYDADTDNGFNRVQHERTLSSTSASGIHSADLPKFNSLRA